MTNKKLEIKKTSPVFPDHLGILLVECPKCLHVERYRGVKQMKCEKCNWEYKAEE